MCVAAARLRLSLYRVTGRACFEVFDELGWPPCDAIPAFVEQPLAVCGRTRMRREPNSAKTACPGPCALVNITPDEAAIGSLKRAAVRISSPSGRYPGPQNHVFGRIIR
jgi:hypothetical protein